MYRDETWDEPVTLKRGDLFLLVSCARAYDSCLPYGVVTTPFIELLTPEMIAELGRED